MLYASKAEARYAEHLDWLKDEGKIWDWERQIRWPLIVNGEKVCTIVPDFKVYTSPRNYALHEVKGFAQPIWRLKRKLFEALHPDIEYVVVTAAEVAKL